MFPQPEEGFGHFLNDREELQKTFAALSRTDTMNALIHLYRKTEGYVFEGALLAKECGIANDQIDAVLNDLLQLRIVWRKELSVDGEKRTLYHSRPSFNLIALFLVAREIGYKGAYSLHSHCRDTPFLKR